MYFTNKSLGSMIINGDSSMEYLEYRIFGNSNWRYQQIDPTKHGIYMDLHPLPTKVNQPKWISNLEK